MIEFPCFKFEGVRPRLVGQTTTGGQATDNSVQTVKTDGGGRWLFELTEANLNKRENLKAWRAFEAILDGGATEVILNLCDRRQMPGFVSSASWKGVPHSDGTPHSDDTLYQQGLLGPIVTSGAAALRSSFLPLVSVAGFEGGENISILHETAGWRMYRAGMIVGNSVQIRPPLREAITAGTEISPQPKCVVRLQDPDSYAPTVNRLRFARGSVVFMESLNYAITLE